MGRNKEPIKLIQAKGRKHLTKAEIDERENSELPVIAEDISPPDFLNSEQKKKFYNIAEKMQKIGIISDLDCDVLGRYIIAESDFLFYKKMCEKTRKKLQTADDFEEEELLEVLMKYEKQKSTAFNQCHTCASSLGMTITSRCKIIVPQAKEEPKKNKFGGFIRSG